MVQWSVQRSNGHKALPSNVARLCVSVHLPRIVGGAKVNGSVRRTRNRCARHLPRIDAQLVPWIRRFLLKCLPLRRRIQSNTAFARSVHTRSSALFAWLVAAAACASTASNALFARLAAAAASASMASNAPHAWLVAAAACASMASDALDAWLVAAAACASTASDAPTAPSARTCLAPLKGVLNSAIDSAVRRVCSNTCVSSTVIMSKRSRRLKS